MPDPNARDAKLIQYLNEAYGKEKQLETALQAHIAMTTRPPYKRRLKQHLKETKAHARTVERRIKKLGGAAEGIESEAVFEPEQEGAVPASPPLQVRILWPALGFPAVIAPRSNAMGTPLADGDATRCISLLVLSNWKYLGKEDVALSDGSWSEWGADPATPQATGPAA